jgi:hypothetical protein
MLWNPNSEKTKNGTKAKGPYPLSSNRCGVRRHRSRRKKNVILREIRTSRARRTKLQRWAAERLI